MKELLASIGLAAVTSIGRAQLIEMFSKIKENNNAELFENALISTYSTFSMLAELAAKSKTKIDDSIVAMVLQAVSEVASDNGVELKTTPVE